MISGLFQDQPLLKMDQTKGENEIQHLSRFFRQFAGNLSYSGIISEGDYDKISVYLFP